MAVVLASTTSYYERATNLPSIDAFTMMCWGMYTTIADWNYVFSFGLAASARFVAVGVGTGTLGQLYLYTGGADVPAIGIQLAVDTWYHFTISNAGTGAADLKLYLDGVMLLDESRHNSCTNEQFHIGSNIAGDAFSGRVAAFKLYGAVLTANDILNEMMSYTPKITENLNTWCPFLNVETTDYSGNGYTLTQNGTPTLDNGPPIPWVTFSKKTFKGAAAAPVVPKRNPMILMGV